MSVTVRLVGLAFVAGMATTLLIIRAEMWYRSRRWKRMR